MRELVCVVLGIHYFLFTSGALLGLVQISIE
jgi:hypothetical protein